MFSLGPCWSSLLFSLLTLIIVCYLINVRFPQLCLVSFYLFTLVETNKQYDILKFLLISEIMEYTVDCTLFLSSFCSRCLGTCAVGFQFVSLFVHMLYYCRDDILPSFSNIYYIKQACNPLLYLSRKTLSFGRSS